MIMKKHVIRYSYIIRSVVSLVFVVGGSWVMGDDGKSGPNIVMMLADDLGYSDLSCYGSQDIHTPNLDKLASEGMRFTDFYAGSAVCSPSRACLLTGRFSVRAGIYSWIHTSQNMHLRREEITIAELLQSKGYSTAHIGKWHLGYQLESGSGKQPNPGDQGFDHWMATGNNANPSHKNPKNFIKNGVSIGETSGYSCELVVDEAIRWMDDDRDPSVPFFLNVWFHEPHARVAAPETFRSRHLDKRNPDYYGCIENMDHEIGRLLHKLDSLGVTENTFIVFTSDNGSYMQGSNGVLAGRKTQLWEGGIRAPGIFKWPGKIPAGFISSVPAGVVDLLPTVCGVAGIDIPTDRTIDGTSLLPLFNSNPVAIDRRTPLYWFYHPSRPVCVIRYENFCLIADPEINLSQGNMFKESFIGDIKKSKLTNFRLYHLVDDPGQKNDLAKQLPLKFEKMKMMMIATHTSVMEEAHDWRTSPF